MNNTSWAILCLAYIIGLLSTGILGFASQAVAWQIWGGLALGWGLLGLVLGLVVPRWWRTAPRLPLWLVAGLVAAFAVVHLQLREPQPVANDISHLVAQGTETVTVSGTIADGPTLNRKQNVRFFLAADRANNREVSGQVYVTLPLLQGTGLVSGQRIKVRGNLYQPKPATHPGAFDFQAFLARQRAFSGLRGNLVEEPKETPWGWWQIRQRIARAQVRPLGSPAGPLVSSMVLGQRAVDLSQDVRDRFRQAGLSHVLAASGFQVSLLLGVVLTLTRNLGRRVRLGLGGAILLIYVGLTGVQPSVMRAALMGAGVLIALSAERKIKPLGLLLLVAALLLLFNPLWIWDLGFQLSFLATLGLIVTVPAITQRLDWLPPAIATLIAVPLAASLWTLPLLIYVFNTVATYSLIVNIISTPLISLISLGGMLSAVAALIFPPAGSAIAWLLDYPTQALLWLVEFFTRLPGNSWAVGTISLGQLLLVYALILLVCCVPWFQRRWGFAFLFVLMLIILPIAYHKLTLVQVTVLPARDGQAIAIQDRGKVTLIDSSDEDAARYTVLPFLRNQGLNAIALAVALENPQQGGWQEISENLPIKIFFANAESPKTTVKARENLPYQPLKIGQTLKLGSTALRVLSTQPLILQLQIQGQKGLIVRANPSARPELDRALHALPDAKFDVLFWSGLPLRADWLTRLKPQVAIAPSPQDSPQTQLYDPERDGAVQWTPYQGWQTISDGD
jgi:competence protein ComEC